MDGDPFRRGENARRTQKRLRPLSDLAIARIPAAVARGDFVWDDNELLPWSTAAERARLWWVSALAANRGTRLYLAGPLKGLWESDRLPTSVESDEDIDARRGFTRDGLASPVTDACLFGGGVVYDSEQISVFFNEPLLAAAEGQIGRLELFMGVEALLHLLRPFLPTLAAHAGVGADGTKRWRGPRGDLVKLHDGRVLLRCDNTQAVLAGNRGWSADAAVEDMARECGLALLDIGLNVVWRHCAGRKNVADGPSRLVCHKHDCHLLPTGFTPPREPLVDSQWEIAAPPPRRGARAPVRLPLLRRRHSGGGSATVFGTQSRKSFHGRGFARADGSDAHGLAVWCHLRRRFEAEPLDGHH